MRIITRFLIGLTLLATCLTPSLQAKDITMDKSPDGNFALRIYLPKEAGDQPKVGMINLPTEEAVLELDCGPHCMRVTQNQSLFGSATHSGWHITLPMNMAAARKSIFVAAHPLKKCNCPVYRTCRFREKGCRMSKRLRKLVNRSDGSNQGRSSFIRNRKGSLLAARPRK